MGFPRKLISNPKTLIIGSHTQEDIFNMSPGERKIDVFADTHIYCGEEPNQNFKAARNEETGHECKYESSQNPMPTDFDTTEIFTQIVVELRVNGRYFVSKYEATNATDEEINSMTNDAEITFTRWCALIGATPPDIQPPTTTKSDSPIPPKPQTPADDEIQF